MSEASFASLGPTLLARKGGAKPAMRPQLAPLPELVADEQLEDLGWNDMGGEEPDDAVIVALANNNHRAAAIEAVLTDSPLVRQHLDIADDAECRPKGRKPTSPPAIISVPSLRRSRRKPRKGKNAPLRSRKPNPRRRSQCKSRRAAFTLRLDTDRHLKLRLAATMQGMSAQALVTEALDALLADIEDLDDARSENGRSYGLSPQLTQLIFRSDDKNTFNQAADKHG